MPAIDTRVTTAKDIGSTVPPLTVVGGAAQTIRPHLLSLLSPEDMPDGHAQDGVPRSPVFVPSYNENISEQAISGNGLKGYIDGILLGALTPYTPVITSNSGTFTTVSAVGRYRQVGKLIFIQITISITTNGTAASFVKATLPISGVAAPSVEYCFAGRALVSGKMLQGNIGSGGGVLSLDNYDNTYPGADGETLVVSGFYETP
jgi:hypothetical protein